MSAPRAGTARTPDGRIIGWEQQELPLDVIRLPAGRWLHAATVGLRRHVAHGGPAASTKDPRNELANHVLGAVAECAVADELALDWKPDATPDRERGDLLAPFVGAIEVRYTWRANGRLTIYEGEPDRPYVLVTGASWAGGTATVRCPGWILGADGQASRFYTERLPSGSPAYLVPQSELIPLDSLKRWTEGKGS